MPILGVNVNAIKRTKTIGRKNNPPMELFLGPWIDVTSQSRVPPKAIPPQEVLPPATVVWGEESEFLYENTFREESNFRFSVMNAGQVVESLVRVTNPEDESQYVDVRRVDEVTISGRDGTVHVRYR